MGKMVKPEVYFIGSTVMIEEGMIAYLEASGNEDFAIAISDGREKGLSDGEILTSFYAKLCYAALTVGHNVNITQVRDIEGNLKACWDQGHGSVWEHACLNFVVRNCSRIFTHELVRHRVGVAFSQTSGRYCRLDSINFIADPILAPAMDLIEDHINHIEDIVYLIECKIGLRIPNSQFPNQTSDLFILTRKEEHKWIPNTSMSMAQKKKLTSAVRRIAPNGQSNEIGFSVNLRSLRHIVQMRTGRHAEWEIRYVFEQIYKLVKEKYPLVFYGAKEEIIDGMIEVSGMKMQPY